MREQTKKRNQEAGTRKGTLGAERIPRHTAVVVWTPGGLEVGDRETVLEGGHGGYNFFGNFGKDQF